MNSFFRTTIYICIAMIIFSIVVNFIDGLGAFPINSAMGTQVNTTDDALAQLTGLPDPNMNALFLMVTTGAGLAAVLLAFLTHSVTPVGLYIYSVVFWTAWIRTQSILTFGGYLPADYILIFTVGILFLFIASIIGLLTGGG